MSFFAVNCVRYSGSIPRKRAKILSDTRHALIPHRRSPPSQHRCSPPTSTLFSHPSPYCRSHYNSLTPILSQRHYHRSFHRTALESPSPMLHRDHNFFNMSCCGVTINIGTQYQRSIADHMRSKQCRALQGSFCAHLRMHRYLTDSAMRIGRISSVAMKVRCDGVVKHVFLSCELRTVLWIYFSKARQNPQ